MKPVNREKDIQRALRDTLTKTRAAPCGAAVKVSRNAAETAAFFAPRKAVLS